tara:strand:- start:93 stop:341 length:249 start_codon:yes stop_codon:yes gene_type:complete
MKTIHKYYITKYDKIEMPKGASIVSCNMQGTDCCIWALVDTQAELELRDFEYVGTGWELQDGMSYIGTCFEGDFVWHIMEIV